MVVLKENFVLLTAILNNVLFVNIPHGVQHIAICFEDCSNRTAYALMSYTVLNDGHLPVFYAEVPSTTRCKLKLIFHDRTEGDADWLTIQNHTVKYINQDFNITAASLGISTALSSELNNIFILTCFCVSSLIVLLLKIVLKYFKRKINVEY